MMNLFYNWQYDPLYLHCSKTWSHALWVLYNTIYLPCHFYSSLRLHCTLHSSLTKLFLVTILNRHCSVKVWDVQFEIWQKYVQQHINNRVCSENRNLITCSQQPACWEFFLSFSPKPVLTLALSKAAPMSGEL